MVKEYRKALKHIDKNSLPNNVKMKYTKKLEAEDNERFILSSRDEEIEEITSSNTPKISNRGRNRNVTTRGVSYTTSRVVGEQTYQTKRKSLVGSDILKSTSWHPKRPYRMIKKPSTQTSKHDFDRLKPHIRRLNDQSQQAFTYALSGQKEKGKAAYPIDSVGDDLPAIELQHENDDLELQVDVEGDKSDDDMNCDSSDDLSNLSDSSSTLAAEFSTVKSPLKKSVASAIVSYDKNNSSRVRPKHLDSTKETIDNVNTNLPKLVVGKNNEKMSVNRNSNGNNGDKHKIDIMANCTIIRKKREESRLLIDTPPGSNSTIKVSTFSPRSFHTKEDNDKSANNGEESIEAWFINGHSSSPFQFEIEGKKYVHPALPPGWKMRISESGKRPVYTHPDHGSTWHCPIKLTPNVMYTKTVGGRFTKQSKMLKQHRLDRKSCTLDQCRQRTSTRQTPPSTRNPLSDRHETKRDSLSIDPAEYHISPQFRRSPRAQQKDKCRRQGHLLRSCDRNTQAIAMMYPLSPQDSTTQILRETTRLSAQLMKNSSLNLKSVKKVHRSTQRLAKGHPVDKQRANFDDQHRLLHSHSEEDSETPSTMSGVIHQYDKTKGRQYSIPISLEMDSSHSSTQIKNLCHKKKILDAKTRIEMNKNECLSPILETKQSDGNGVTEQTTASKKDCDNFSKRKYEPETIADSRSVIKTQSTRDSECFTSAESTIVKTQPKKRKQPIDKVSTLTNSTKGNSIGLEEQEQIEAWFTPPKRANEDEIDLEDDVQSYEDVSILRLNIGRSQKSTIFLHSTDANVHNDSLISSTKYRYRHGSDKKLLSRYGRAPTSPTQLSIRERQILKDESTGDLNTIKFVARTPTDACRGTESYKPIARSKKIPREIYCESQENLSPTVTRQQALRSEKKGISEEKVDATKLVNLGTPELKDSLQFVEDCSMPEKGEMTNVNSIGEDTKLNKHEGDDTSVYAKNEIELDENLNSGNIYGEQISENVNALKGLAIRSASTEKRQSPRYNLENNSYHSGASSIAKDEESTFEFGAHSDGVSDGYQSSGFDSTKEYSVDHSNRTPISLTKDLSVSTTSGAENCSLSSSREPGSYASNAASRSDSVVESGTFDDASHDASSIIEENDGATSFASRASSRVEEENDEATSFGSTSSVSTTSHRSMGWRVLNPPHPLCTLQMLDKLILERKRKELKARRSQIGNETKTRKFSGRKRWKMKRRVGL